MNEQVAQNHEPSQCPSCGSEVWKLASLIHAEGTTHAQSLTAGGIASEIDNGAPIAIGFTQKIERSKLAELAAPPSRQTVKWQRLSTKSNRAMATGIILGVLAAVTLILTEAQSGVLNSIIVPALIFSMYKMLQFLYLLFIGPEAAENRKRKATAKVEEDRLYQSALDRYRLTRCCLRCGHFYVPATSVAPQGA